MENLGEYLQQKREEQNISIEELVSLTRIPVRFIEAIETNRLDLLPNQVTAKGFLRSYAECVGVDHRRITEAFSEYATPSEPFSDSKARDKILSHVQVEKSNRLPFPRRIVLSVAGLVFALLTLVGLLSKKDKEINVLSSILPPKVSAPENPVLPEILETELVSEALPFPDPIAPETPLPSEDKTMPPEPEAASDEDEGKMDTLKPEDPETEVAMTAPTDLPDPTEVRDADPVEDTSDLQGLQADVEEVKEYVLSLEAMEASWVQVTIDDEDVREALLQPNDAVEWKASKKFRLTLGNAGGVRVQLDGRDLGPFGPSGQVVHKDILGESAVELN